jgi:hypothetical protein
MNQEPAHSSFVRFTREEYLRLKRDSLETGKSIPWLLKTAYFQGSIATPTLDVESRKSVLRTLAYMGNNLNQLVKNVNSGLISNVKGEVSEILGTCRMLRSFLGLNYGDRKDSL